jgi:hypothetical protein
LAKAKRAAEDGSLEEHSILRKIRESGQLQNVTFLKGYVGKSDNYETVRLYLDLNFDRYFDISKSDIVHSALAPENMLPFGGTCLWVSKEAQISQVKVEPTKLQAQFLQGRISRRYLKPEMERMARFTRLPVPDDTYVGSCIVCPTDICTVACPTRTWDWCCQD